MKTSFVSREVFASDLQNIIEELESDYKRANLILTEELYPARINSYQAIARLLKTSYRDRKKRAICSLMFKDIYRAELLSGGAGEVAFNFTIAFAKALLAESEILKTNQVELIHSWESFLDRFRKIVESCGTDVKRRDINAGIREMCEDEDLSTAVIEAVNLAGLEGKIVIQNSKQNHYVVELKHGYSFKLHPYKYFLDENGGWERRDCKMLVVDGFIESISEMDRLLNEVHDSKQPMVLVSSGFSEEVVATLYTNYKNGKLDVLPLRLKSDIHNLNVLNDIGIVSGRDPISSMKGELLTFVKLAEVPSVERISVIEGRTTIENSKTVKAVSEQIRGLLNKRTDNQFIEDVQTLYENRIESLSPLIAVINLPDMSSVRSDAFKIRIDNALRTTKSFLNYGILADYGIHDMLGWDSIRETGCDPKTSNFATSPLEEILCSVLYDNELYDRIRISPMSYYLGIHMAGITILNLLASGGFIELDVT